MLIFHITIALTSLVCTGLAFLKPSQTKLQVSYVLVALTVATGSYLIWSLPANMLSSCISGLIYLGVVTSGILSARFKLARAANYK